MNRFVCALFEPDETVPERCRRYTSEWVIKLGLGLNRHCSANFEIACLTDTPQPFRRYGFHRPNAPGWAKLMECFRPDVVGDRAMILDLDTVVVGDLGKLFELDAELLCARDPYEPAQLANGVFVVDGELAVEVWEHWEKNWREEIASGRYALENAPFSEMLWMREHLTHRCTFIDDVAPGALLSYKAHVEGKLQEKPDECLAVYYHGSPKQDDPIPEAWAKEGWD